VHRDKVYDDEIDDDIMELDVAKQRGGLPNVTAYFEYLGSYAKIIPTDGINDDGVDDIGDNDFQVPSL